jgi:hypothetical protein
MYPTSSYMRGATAAILSPEHARKPFKILCRYADLFWKHHRHRRPSWGAVLASRGAEAICHSQPTSAKSAPLFPLIMMEHG